MSLLKLLKLQAGEDIKPSNFLEASCSNRQNNLAKTAEPQPTWQMIAVMGIVVQYFCSRYDLYIFITSLLLPLLFFLNVFTHYIIYMF